MDIKGLSGTWRSRLIELELPSITDEQLTKYLKTICPAEIDENINFSLKI